VRARGGVDLGVMSLAAFSERLRLEVEQRSNSQVRNQVPAPKEQTAGAEVKATAGAARR
jgi:hypothetical protein